MQAFRVNRCLRDTTTPFQNAVSKKQSRKKRAGREALLKNCVDPVFPKNSNLILIVGVALLVRAGLLPRLGPPDLSLAAGLRLHW
jgi:hypothetical protein